jgi:squalene synthase HpnC
MYITAMRDPALTQAYRHCAALARAHYENFPVASRLLPRALREPIAVIYAFARTADDFADEGDRTPEQRLALLGDFSAGLEAAIRSQPPDDPVFIALADVLRRHQLPVQLLRDLLTAFRADVTTHRYATFADVLDYCRCSANPVGRLLLHLHGAASETNLRHSDAICTALQLINFYQDLAQDIEENNRIYIPQDEMARAGVTEQDLRARRDGERLRALLDQQLDRARALMLSGAPLARSLSGRFGFEIRLIVAGGLRVLDAMQRRRSTVFARPRLRGADWAAMIWTALSGAYPQPAAQPR